MTKHYPMTATKRERAGKGAARALRRENKIPAVIYGDNKAPVTISLSARDANVEYNKGHMFTTLCDLDVDGEKNLVLARDIQLHPVMDFVEHIDFLRVTNKTKIKVAVPVQFTGYENSPAEQKRGVMNVVRHEIEIECVAQSIPDAIEVDVSGVAIGDSIKSTDISLPEGAAYTLDREFTIATVVAPRAAIEEEPAEGEATEGAEGASEGEEKAEGGEDAKSEE